MGFSSEPKMRKPIVVMGSVNFDLVATAERVPLPGETLTGIDFGTFYGGQGRALTARVRFAGKK